MTVKFSRRTWCLFAASALAVASAPTLAQNSSRPIKLIVPIPAGGAPDIVARVVGQKLSELLDQPVVVENHAGSNGNIAGDLVAKAAPDGHTLLLGQDSLITINPHLYAKMPFDPLKDLAPVTLAASTPNVLVVHPSLPVTTVRELIALARARPGAINFASSGQGTPAQLAGELFNSMAGVKMVHVPYKGAAPALADLLGGQVQVMFSTMPPALPHVTAGRLRALAVASLRRSPAAPELPTLDETALPGFEATTWHGVMVPAGTPSAIVAKLHDDIVAVLRTPEIAERLSSQGAEAIGNTPEEFASYIRSETAKWAKVVRESGAKLE